MDYFPGGNILYKFSCYNPEHVQNIPDCSQTSAPDKPTLEQQSVQSVQSNTVNVLKCRKSAVTALYVYGLFAIFYIPFCATMFVETFIGYTVAVKIAYDYATTAVYINSALNPLVYCWRIGKIRRAVKNTMRTSFCRSTSCISM